MNKKDDGDDADPQGPSNLDVEGGAASDHSTELTFERVFVQSLTLTFFAEWGDR